MKISNIKRKLYFLPLLASFSAFSAVDIDQDNDGIVDDTAYETNLLTNANFNDELLNWTVSYLYSATLENRFEIDDLLVTTKSDSRGGLGYIEQELSFAELGFSDSTTLDSALADNAMQVKFGGWSAGDGATIQVTFKDADGVMIGLPAIISNASTERYIWMERELTALIPEGTRSISYRVDLEASDSQSSRLDDVFLNIELADDSDADDVLDANDIDNDNNGIIDVEFTDRNLLANNSFLKRQTDWTFSYLYSVTLENRLDIDDLLVTTKSDSRGGLGYIEQELSFAELGFSDSTTLDRALADNAMQVKFGGWSAGDGAAIQVTFKDADGVIIGLPAIISNASTERYIWMERELTALIPEGTRSISYRVDLEASDSQSSRLDDVFLNIELADDSDADDVLDANDIDNDNNGIIDVEFTDRNLLANNSFLKRQTDWTFSYLYSVTLKNRLEIDDLLVTTKSDSRGGLGYIEQELSFAELGFSDSTTLDRALADNAMQVKFGGWSAGDGATIQVTFKDADGVMIGLPAIISNASTERYIWMERELTALIPEGTRSISYRVDLEASDSQSSRLDDVFLNIELADDSDADDVLDANDIDNDNNGIIDVEFTDRNLLANNSFLKRQTDWTFSYLYSVTLENRLGIDDLLVTTKSDSRGGLGYIEQELSFAELGFSDSTTLDRALADNAMQVKFGGWSAGDGAAIQVTFKDADGVMIGLPVIISKASTERYIWMERELTALIPEGTRSISYRVDLEASDSQSSRLDDVFLYIHDLRDSDGDGLGNSTEFLSGTNPEVADTDGDGAVDAIDVFPLNPAEWLDTDNDGIGNNADLDGDNDGVEDTVDAFPLDQTESLDTDGDGIGNNADLDDDGDGIVDVDDIEPLNDAIGDVQAPIFDVITNLEFEATGLTTAIELNIPQVSDDNLNIPTISSDYSGPLSIGEHTITWTAIDYAGNTTKAEQVISIVDTTSPVFSKMEIISITAQGVLTDISDLVSINAIDLVDGEVIASAVFSDFYYSGIHYIEFKAIDNSGNEVELEQEVHINPLINVGLNKVATSNSVSTLDVYLSGEAAKYPVTINYELSGSAIDNVTGQLIINEGISSALLIDIPVDAVTGEQAILTLLSAENAKLTDDVKVTLSVINDNYAPDVSVLTYQNNLSVQVINPHDGVVTVKAIISDINNSDTHDIQWNSEFSDIVDLSNDDLMSTFELSPQYISNGVYALTVTVKEKDTEELLSIKQTIALVVDDNLDELSLESDADKDGISDSEEGYQDSDKDGISDYLDIDIIPYRLPWSLGQLPIETVSGLRLSLGNIILPSRSVHAQYATIDFAELALFGSINFSEVDNAFDYHFEPQDKIMNFNVSGLSLAGDSIPVIVPLSYGKMIAEDAIYRIYNENNGWQDFMLDSHNSIASAKRDPIGNCPPLKSSKYSLGLASGDNCIKLVISDGGLNDSDGAVSGKVAVIGALAGELTNQLPQITIPSEYTFDEEYYVSIDASSTSDAENDELTFNWRQISGSNVEIVNASSPEVSFTTPSVSSDMAFTLELSVFDGRDSAISLISVNVQHVNKPPVVIITDHPATVNEGSSITLVSDNSDPDGDSLSYYWEQISGPTVMMSDNSSASVKFTAPEITSDSVIEVRLTSSDDVVSVSTVTKITIKNVEPTHEEKNESSDSGGSMGWTLILLGLIASRRINK